MVPKVHRHAGDPGASSTHPDARGRLRSKSIGRKALVVGTTAVAASTTFVGTAYAAIVEPPQPPLEVVVFPERDFVVTEGGPADQSLTFEIWRQGFRIGVASSEQVTPAMTTDADGLLEINHPGGLCWQGSTPDIRPGDRLVVFDNANTADGYAVTTQGVRATNTEVVGNDVVVHGVALNAQGNPMPLSRVEQRIINPDFREGATPLERRDIRATTDEGNLRPDPAVRGGFIATHSGLNAENRQKALDGQTRVLGWQNTNAAGDRMGITIWEEDELGGPGFGGCPQGQQGPTAPQLAAAQDSGQKGDHITNQSANLTFRGLAGSDTEGVSPEPGAGAEVQLLVDGTEVGTPVTATATGVYQFTGINLPAGSHTVRARAKDPGDALPFLSDPRRVVIDATRPTVVLRRARPTPLHLEGPERMQMVYRVGEAAQLQAKVMKRTRTVKTFAARTIRAAGLVEYFWDGKTETRRNVRPGRYKMVLTATDRAGNQTTNVLRFRVAR